MRWVGPFAKKPRPRKMDAGTQMSHGDFRCRKRLSQKTIASPQRETYSASISIKRPFSIIPMFVIQMRAARIDPSGPRLARATVTNASGHCQHDNCRWQTCCPFVTHSKKSEGCGYQPVHERRLSKIWISSNFWDDVVPRLEHSDRRQDSSSFFSFDCNRTKRR